MSRSKLEAQGHQASAQVPKVYAAWLVRYLFGFLLSLALASDLLLSCQFSDAFKKILETCFM